MFPFANRSAVAARWRTITAGEEATVDVLLEDASDMIRVRWPDIDDRVAAGSVDSKTLVRIVSAMVRRAMMNRGNDGVKQEQSTAGPFSGQVTYSNPDGNLYLTAQDITDLSAPTARATMGWLA